MIRRLTLVTGRRRPEGSAAFAHLRDRAERNASRGAAIVGWRKWSEPYGPVPQEHGSTAHRTTPARDLWPNRLLEAKMVRMAGLEPALP